MTLCAFVSLWWRRAQVTFAIATFPCTLEILTYCQLNNGATQQLTRRTALPNHQLQCPSSPPIANRPEPVHARWRLIQAPFAPHQRYLLQNLYAQSRHHLHLYSTLTTLCIYTSPHRRPSCSSKQFLQPNSRRQSEIARLLPCKHRHRRAGAEGCIGKVRTVEKYSGRHLHGKS